jgi:glycosyltransferase involved in cell wall biosynthesis
VPTDPTPSTDSRPLVASLIGTYLKPEMQSVYRQVINLQRYRAIVLAETRENAGKFPEPPEVRILKKRPFRPRGNFLKRFWFKHIVKQWPPPGYVEPQPPPDYESYDLIPHLKAMGADVLHIYYGHKAVKFLPMVKKWGGPFIVSFHGVDVSMKDKAPEYPEQLRELFSVAHLVLARSQSLLDELAAFGCPAEKLRMNRTPIPLGNIAFQQKTPPADGQWRFIQACRLIEKKGLYTTLQAMPKILERWPHAKFQIAGEGPLAEKLRERIVAAGLQNNVELLGWCDQPRLLQYFADAHFFIHPSETTKANDQEGVPNSMLEAMAAGLPIVATQHGGIPEAMTSEIDGYLVPEKSPDLLAAAILKLCGDPPRFEEFSRQARATVTERYGLENQIAALEAAYDEAISLSG